MRASWQDRYNALRTLGAVALAIFCLVQACGPGDDADVGAHTAAEDEAIPLLPSEPHGVGATGRFEVLHDGSAAYVIPLEVPPGRAGVQPTLSLTYNSRAGDGPLGVGWSLGGLSGISRCGWIAEIDGRNRTVQFDNDDRLCLDGRRLVHVGGAAHGMDGAVYRPQRNGFERVTLHGALTDAASFFVVEHPDGTRSEYGQESGDAHLAGYRYTSDDAGLPTAPEFVTHTWALARRFDAWQNSMEYVYERLVTTSPTGREAYELRLLQIRYTGHFTLGAGDRSVRFHYREASRTQALSSFVSGLHLKQTHLLDRISMHAPGDALAVREYRFDYDPSRHTGRDLLLAVRVCDSDLAGAACLPPTEFDYSQAPDGSPSFVQFSEHQSFPTPLGWFPEPCGTFAWSARQPFIVAGIDDVAGDDILYITRRWCDESQYTYRMRITRDGYFQPDVAAGIAPEPWGVFQLPAPPLIAFDLDNDGRTEILDVRDDPPAQSFPTLRTWEFEGGGLALRAADLFDCQSQQQAGYTALLGDLDASGAADILSVCRISSTELRWSMKAHLPTTHDFGPPSVPFATDGWSTGGNIVDYDGDGAQDLLFQSVDQTMLSARSIDHLTGNSIEIATNIPAPATPQLSKLVYLDVNGDGLRDLLDLANGALATIRLNTGNHYGEAYEAFVQPAGGLDPAPYTEASPSAVRVADFNHDGRVDFALLYRDTAVEPSAQYISFHYSNGARFEVMGSRPIPADPSVHPDTGKASWAFVQTGDVDGDGELDLVVADPQSVSVLRNTYSRPDLLTDVRVGNDELSSNPPVDVLEIAYEHASSGRRVPDYPFPGLGQDRILYTADSSVGSASACVFPQQCVYRGVTVVAHHSEVTTTLPSATATDLYSRVYYEYAYEGGRIHSSTGSFMGFRRRTRTQWYWVNTGVIDIGERRDREVTRWEYDLDTVTPDGMPAFTGAPIVEERYLVHPIAGRYRGRRIEHDREAVTVAGFPTSITFIRSRGTEIREFDSGSPMPLSMDSLPHYRRVVRGVGYDTYSMPQHWTTTVERDSPAAVAQREEVWATPTPDALTNRFDRYESARKISAVEEDELEPQELTISFGYHLASGTLSRVTVAGSEAAYTLEHTPYDTTGVPGRIEERSEWSGGPAVVRAVDLEYDAERLFPTAARRQVGPVQLTTSYTYHPGLGLLQRVVSPADAWAQQQHDRFGRLRRVDTSSGAWATASYSPGESATDQYQVTVLAHDGSQAEVWIDLVGRSRERRIHGLHPDEWWVSEERYGLFGELASTVLPHFDGDAVAETTYHYDDLVRLIRVVRPDGVELTRSYPTPLSLVATNGRGYSRQYLYDVAHRLRSVREPDGAEITYQYGSYGRLQRADVPGPNEWYFEYDSMGFPFLRQDNTTGQTLTYHDGMGQLRSMERGGDSTTFEYDELGRLRTRLDSDGTTRWTYDTCAVASRGLLCRTDSPDGTVEQYAYGGGATAGQLVSYDISSAGRTANFEYGYDRGRLDFVEIDGGAGATVSDVLIDNSYGTYGHFDAVSVREIPGVTLWRAEAIHPQGFVSTERFGNGQEFNWDRDISVDRLLTMESPHQTLIVEYDENFNVSTSTVSGVGHGSGSVYSYDSRDRISGWSQDYLEGVYSYDAAGNAERLDSTFLVYDASGVLDEAMAMERSWPFDVVTDSRGRITLAATRGYAYTDFDLPRLVDNMAEWSFGTGGVCEYRYTADQVRSAVLDEESGSVTFHAGDLYERRDLAGDVYEIFRVPGPERLVAEVTAHNGALDVRYLHHDHLGSTMLTTDSSGNPGSPVLFSPFGRRIDDGGGYTSLVDADGSLVVPDDAARFAGHALDEYRAAAFVESETGLINMRGRIYDPLLGRFLTPDPMVGYGVHAAAWDAFGYVENNPSTLVDPTGFTPDGPRDELTNWGFGDSWATGIADFGSPGWLGFESVVATTFAVTHIPIDVQQEAQRDVFRTIADFGAGVIDGLLPVQDIGSPFNHDTAWNAGRLIGSVVGLGVDASMIVSGVGAVGTAVGGEVVTLGGATVPAVAVGAAGVASILGGVAMVPAHGRSFVDALSELNRPQINMSEGAPSAPPNTIAGTHGLQHSFDRHAHEWFGREVSRSTHMNEWQALVERAARSRRRVPWRTGEDETIGHLARIDGKYFFVQFFRDGPRAGELATAFVPSRTQLARIVGVLNR